MSEAASTQSLNTQTSNSPTSSEQKEVDRVITRLKILDTIRTVALPVAALAAGVSAVAAPITFPIAAATGAIAIGIGQLFARKERAHLSKHLESLKKKQILSSDEIEKLSSTANKVTVSGPSYS